MNAIPRRLRAVLLRAWGYDADRDRVIDYDRTRNIDWADDFDPNEPRVGKGQPGGGQWTVGGGGTAPASPALTKYAGPAGAKFKKLVDAHLAEMSMTTATPEQVETKVKQLAEDMKTAGGTFKSSNVAGYLNQLIHHLEVQHGYAPGTLGKAVKKKEDGEPTVAIVPPTDEDMKKMAAEAALAPQPLPPATFSLDPTGLPMPADDPGFTTQTNLYATATDPMKSQATKIAEIEADIKMGYNFKGNEDYANALIAALSGQAPATGPAAPEPAKPAEPVAPEPTAQIAPAAPDLPPQGASFTPQNASTTQGQEAIDKITEIAGNKWAPDEKIAWIEALAGDIPDHDAGALAQMQTEIAKLKGTPAPAQATTPTAEPEPQVGNVGSLPEPTLKTQKKIYDIVNGHGTNAEKIEQINAILPNMTHPPNIEYAEQAITLLEDAKGAVGAAAGTPDPEPEATPAAQAPEENEALLKVLPSPAMFKTWQGETWQIAQDPSLTAEAKVAQIKTMIPQMVGQDDKDYADNVLNLLGVKFPTAEPAAPEPPATAPVDLSTLSPTATGVTSTNAMEFWSFANTVGQGMMSNQKAVEGIQKLLAAKLANNSISQESKTAKYAQSLIAALGGGAAQTTPEPATTGPDLNQTLGPNQLAALKMAIPLPGGPQAEQDLWETAAMGGNWTAAKKIAQLEADMKTDGIAEEGTTLVSKQTHAYAQSLIDFLKGYDPNPASPDTTVAAGTPPASLVQPVAITEPVGELKNSTYAMGAYQIAIGPEDPKTKAENITNMVIKAVLAGTLKEDSPAYNHALGMSVTLNNQAAGATQSGGGTQALYTPFGKVPAVPPGLDGSGYPNDAYNIALATPGGPTDKMLAVAKFHANAIKNNAYFENSPVGIYVKSIITALGGTGATAPTASTSTAPTIPSYVSSEQKPYVDAIQAIGEDSNLTPADKIGKINAQYNMSGYFAGSYVGQHKDEWIKYLGQQASTQLSAAPTSTAPAAPPPPIPSPKGGPGTIQGKIYKMANAYGVPLDQKIANIQAVTSKIWSNKNYKSSVLKALQAKQAANPITPPAPKAPPTTPPMLDLPEQSSNTQTSMWKVAAKNPTDPQPMSNPEKIAEITKILANSSGGAGGKAETYANKLITALGGQATTKAAALAANAPTPITPTPYSGGGSVGTPTNPPGSDGGPPLRSSSAKILARGEKIWNAAAKITGIKNAEALAAAPSLDKAYWAKVPQSTQKTIIDYVGSGSSDINGALRDPMSASTSVAKQIHGIEEAFDMPEAKVTQDVIMTRGLNMSKADIDKLKKYLELGIPANYFMQGYGSSSMHPTTPAFHNKPVWLEMVVRKGTPALGVGGISTLPENELILEHGQVFDVHEIRVENGKTKIRMVSRPPADTGDRAWRKR